MAFDWEVLRGFAMTTVERARRDTSNLLLLTSNYPVIVNLFYGSIYLYLCYYLNIYIYSIIPICRFKDIFFLIFDYIIEMFIFLYIKKI